MNHWSIFRQRIGHKHLPSAKYTLIESKISDLLPLPIIGTIYMNPTYFHMNYAIKIEFVGTHDKKIIIVLFSLEAGWKQYFISSNGFYFGGISHT